jgi:hypothetical protein
MTVVEPFEGRNLRTHKRPNRLLPIWALVDCGDFEATERRLFGSRFLTTDHYPCNFMGSIANWAQI